MRQRSDRSARRPRRSSSASRAASISRLSQTKTRRGRGAPGATSDISRKGSINPTIEEVAFNLKPGEVSGVIETPQGFYIIKALDKRGGGSLTVKATRAEVDERIFSEKIEKKYAEWLAEKRQKSHIEIRLQELK